VRSQALERAAAATTAALLGVFLARRALFLTASLLASRQIRPQDAELPTLLLVVPARNEAERLGRTLAALDALDYPLDRLRIVLVDDGSADATGELMAAYAAARSHALALPLQGPSGKAAALNAAVADSPRSELVGVCDGDHAPRADCFRRLAGAFADPAVGAATAYLLPANADASLISRYTAVEAWVHQLVTCAAKDRLDLNPPLLGGGSVYRREALDEIGGFSVRAHAEDLQSAVSLTNAGWRTRFVPDAVVENLVPARPREYWHQHVRWARSVLDSAEPPARNSSVPLARRVEAVVQAGAYLDRVAVLAGVVLARTRALPPWLPLGYLGFAGVEAAAGVLKGGGAGRLPRFLLATALCFPLDLAGAVAALAAQLARRPLAWRRSS
jgi:1,2-diacylglycerol 3-beta-glucosyltransferase